MNNAPLLNINSLLHFWSGFSPASYYGQDRTTQCFPSFGKGWTRGENFARAHRSCSARCSWRRSPHARASLCWTNRKRKARCALAKAAARSSRRHKRGARVLRRWRASSRRLHVYARALLRAHRGAAKTACRATTSLTYKRRRRTHMARARAVLAAPQRKARAMPSL